MPSATVPVIPDENTLFSRQYLPFVIAAVSLVTLAAFENRATTTILPSVARDLDGLSLFGAAAAGPMVSYVVGVSIAGLWADRSGPVPVLATGIVGFTIVAGLAAVSPVMEMFVAVRLAAGVAEGILDIGLTVMVARAIPPELRARLFSLYAAAWVLPSLVGQSIAGLVAEHVHWRAVFLIAVVLMPPLDLLLRPATRPLVHAKSAVETHPGPSSRSTVTSAVVAVAMGGIALSGSMFSSHGVLTAVAVALALAGLGLLVPTVQRLLPDGVTTLRRGAPSLIAVSAVTAAAFTTPGAFLPLMLTTVHGMPPAGTGLSLQYQAASALLATVASTIPVGAAGAAIAWFAPSLPGGLFAAIMSVGVAAGIAGAAIAHRVAPAPTDDPSVDHSRMASAVAA